MGEVKTALAIWGVVKGILPGLWGRFRARVVGPLPLVPNERRCFWHEVTHKGRATTLAEAEFHVTNTRRTPVVLVAARLPNPPTPGAVSVKLPEASDSWRYGGLPAGAYGLVHATFYIHPPIGAPGKDIIADVVIVDNLNCEHRCRRVVFTPYLSRLASATDPPSLPPNKHQDLVHPRCAGDPTAAAEVRAMTRWAYCVLLLPPTVPMADRDLEAAKRRALKAIAPVVAPRRWFFRRYALRDDDPHGADRRAFRLYVEMGQGDDPLPLLRVRAAAATLAVLPVQVLHVADWDAHFGDEYGGADAQAAMRDFCSEAAPVAIVDGQDPVAVAQRHMDLGRAAADDILHWWMWLRDGGLVKDGPPLWQLWQAALAAYHAGTPPPC